MPTMKIDGFARLSRYDYSEDELASIELPDCYLHVEGEQGDFWLMPIGEGDSLDIKELIALWAKAESDATGYNVRWDGETFASGYAPYSAAILTDGRHFDGSVVWDSCGFGVDYE